MLVLLTGGEHRGEKTLHKVTAALTLRARAHFAPWRGMAQRASKLSEGVASAASGLHFP